MVTNIFTQSSPPHHKKATWNLNCYDYVTTDQLLKNATYSLKTYKKERTY